MLDTNPRATADAPTNNKANSAYAAFFALGS